MFGSLLIPLMVMAAQAPQPTIVQKSSGWCSPNIANVVGNVTVNCIGVDPRALKRLNAELDRKNLRLADKVHEADPWTVRYKELEERLSAAGDDSELSRQAEEYLRQGELDKSRAILDQIISREEKQAGLLAGNHYNRGLLFELEFRPLDALHDLEMAYRYRPEQVKYGQEYAFVLLDQHDFKKAEPVLLATLDLARQAAKGNPTAYQPHVATTLNALAIVYSATGRPKEAEGAYQEALGLRQQLAQANPAAYQPDVALSLNNLAVLYTHSQRLKEAERAYQEALDILRQLTKANTGAYQANVAGMLTNLGNLYRDTQRMKEAEGAYQEALDIRRQLAAANPAAYQSDVAQTLVNLAALYGATQRLKEAEGAIKEALDTYRQLAKANPAAFQADVALALNNLAVIELEADNLTRAQADVEEALNINRELWKANPEVMGDNLAKSLMIRVAVQGEAKQPYSALCPLAREAGAVAYDPQLKKKAADLQALVCNAH
jgi:tetratricopeptide (TPR) repeat protein